MYTLSTIAESNDAGTWRGVSIGNPVLLAGDQSHIYQRAKEFRDMVISGGTRAAYDTSEPESM